MSISLDKVQFCMENLNAALADVREAMAGKEFHNQELLKANGRYSKREQQAIAEAKEWSGRALAAESTNRVLQQVIELYGLKVPTTPIYPAGSLAGQAVKRTEDYARVNEMSEYRPARPGEFDSNATPPVEVAQAAGRADGTRPPAWGMESVSSQNPH